MYEYECADCGHRFERIQKFSDPPVEECPSCGKRSVQKLVSSPAIQFKGSGWYITDYAKKSGVGTDTKKESGESKDSKESASESKESKSESKESKESKPDSKESKSTPASSTTTTSKASGE